MPSKFKHLECLSKLTRAPGFNRAVCDGSSVGTGFWDIIVLQSYFNKSREMEMQIQKQNKHVK